MKLAFVSTQSGTPWAASEFLWEECASLALEAGHEVLVSTYKWKTTHPAVMALARKGAQICRRRRPMVGRFERTIERFCVRWRHLTAFKPDVVCVSQSASYDAIVAPDLGSLPQTLYALEKPFVLVCNALPENWTLNDGARERGRRLFRTAKAAVFISQRNLEIAERHLAATISNATFLHAPANVIEPVPLGWPSDNGVIKMAIIGRLDVATKGHDVLLETLACDVWRNRNWQLSIFGDGPDRKYLEELAHHYGIGERVTFRGHVQDLSAVWVDNHLLVMPSRHEAGPLVVIEAQLYGRPVVATDVGLVPNWIEDGKTGFIAAAATRNALGNALERAWEARDSWAQMGKAAHAKGSSLWIRNPGQRLLDLMTAGDATISLAQRSGGNTRDALSNETSTLAKRVHN